MIFQFPLKLFVVVIDYCNTSMGRQITIFFVFHALFLAEITATYWDSWASTNGGVHNRPVFRFQPSIRWEFSHPTGPSSAGI